MHFTGLCGHCRRHGQSPCVPQRLGSRTSAARRRRRSAVAAAAGRQAAPAPRRLLHVFAQPAALLVARDAWCADPTAANATYGPISLWDISQVTDLSCLLRGSAQRGCNPACSSFNSDISGWDTSIVTTLYVRAASHPLHACCASLLLTRFAECTRTRCLQPTRLWLTISLSTARQCLAFAYHSLCRVQAFARIAFNQPLEAWNVSRVADFPYAPPLILSPASPPPHHTAMASLLSPSSSPIGSSPPLSHTLSSSPPSDSTGRRTRSTTPTL